MHLSHADHSASPPRVEIPRDYNAAHDLLERNAARFHKPAFIDAASGQVLTYGQLREQAHRLANTLRDRGLAPESRVLVAMHDTPEWPVVFLGCILAGVVPVAVNTLLTAADFGYMLRDCRAQALFVSKALLPTFEPLVGEVASLRHVVVAGDTGERSVAGWVAAGSDRHTVASTCSDEPCFWLYSSGSTGAPKGTVHLHAHLVQTAELYGRGVLGIREDDVVYSAAKLFFAYGLGNALSFPLSVGATTVLMAGRPTPDACFARLTRHRPTVFCGAPTGYAGMLASPALPARERVALRLCSSAGEALPQDIGERWQAHFGAPIIDGIGSTEMLHIFLSNRPGDVRYGTTGRPVPGYEVELRGEDGRPVADGEVGDLYIQGPSAALMYWNSRDKSRDTFQGAWTRSGDKYIRNADGTYTYAGRSDDMLKVSGQYVSPFEVEATLVQHAAVLEAAVIGVPDENGLTRVKAYVVLKDGSAGSEALDAELKAFVKARLAPHKYPRGLAFVPELPKTATGKIQRFRLRALSASNS
jgi:benzoate-CoA ligase